MPTTSTPKKLGEGPSGNEHIDVSPVKLTSQQLETTKDTSLDLGWVDSYAEWLHEENKKKTQGEEVNDWQGNYTKCDICGTCCRIASHLRHSDDCLRQLKLQPKFRFQGADNNEVFIIKIALLIGECPSPRCPTGQHSEIPPDCVSWWKSDGWDKMKWRGNRQGADRYTIQERIRKFTNYHHKKNNRQSQTQSESQATTASPRDAPTTCGTSYNENGSKCSSCSEEGHLMQHLQDSVQCLESYVEHYLGEEEVEGRRSIFHLSIILNLCANSNCPDKATFKYLGSHLNRNEECLEFYQGEGAHLSLWEQGASSRIISKKVAYLKRVMKQNKENEQTCGYITYGKELNQLLAHICCRCGSMGPVDGEDAFVMRGGWTYDDDESEALWFCSKCTEESPDYDEFLQKLKEDTDKLKGPRSCQQNAIKVVKSPTSGRLIVTPACLVEESEASEEMPSMSTVVLVPFDGSAMRTIKRCCDEAAPEREELKKHVEDLLRRPFLTDFEATLSCLYRFFLAEARTKMDRMYMALSKGARGEIVSVNPNRTSARKVNPNIDLTAAGALRDSCNWSLHYEQQKSLESEAIAQLNGRVKIYVDGTVMNGLQDENLRRILVFGYKSFLRRDVNSFEELENNPALEMFIASMSPVILNYIRAKAKLFIKHIVTPNFSEYNLRLAIEGLQVQIQGYLYAKEFNQVNKMIAEAPEAELVPEILSRVVKEVNVLPTTTLDWTLLCNNYGLEELRAKKIIEIAQHCQIRNVASPLSLINLFTPSGWNASENEKVLRFRAEQLSQEVNSDDNVEEAIVAITKSLLDEGLFEEVRYEEIDREIRQSMKESLSEVCNNQDPLALNALQWYHTLLFRTGGCNQWTLKRGCGEALIIPYHPLLLEALEQQVEVKVLMEGEHLQAKLDQARGSEIMAGTAWKEISLLNFLHGIPLKNYKEPTSQCTVSVIASQEQEYNFKDSNEKDEECDDVYINSKGESFVITNGDYRKLYMKRPPSLEAMTLAQFLISYYRMTASQQAIIDPQTGVGKETTEVIVGGGEMMLPMFMRLSNGINMKKRSDPSKMVPLLLHNRDIDDYGNRLLFQPWRNVEELVQDQTDDDKRIQRQNCLAIFPMGTFSGQGRQ